LEEAEKGGGEGEGGRGGREEVEVVFFKYFS